MAHKRKLGLKVPPLSAATIEAAARKCRDLFQIKKSKVDICRLIEALQQLGLVELEIVEDHELQGEEARTYPNTGRMIIKNSVYEAAAVGDGRARFTIAHEIGHLDMHRGVTPAFSRGDHQVYEDSEWQADTFASEFLMDSRLIRENDSAEHLVEKFGVSYTAACMKLKKMSR
ncbi:ImmA/IrrE family metallo-endopeptidase [Shewanella sp. SM72]|uniref:ImmA/IrrE family metallo-endopeptidase n=1 Tax=Shewanella sp. SM72 TaxID=2912805 RepID=UPI0021DA66D7|nr:ImmA/IrrE family metallo-endopeptidase [Shewanella sp. SM72]MCU8017852.1 ImmA/IrrE family metallo-endopeptidase [Shewanella sp. SM72]